MISFRVETPPKGGLVVIRWGQKIYWLVKVPKIKDEVSLAWAGFRLWFGGRCVVWRGVPLRFGLGVHGGCLHTAG